MNTSRVLLVTNDFPPTLGGIQSYIRDLCSALDPDQLIVLTSTPKTGDWVSYDAALPFQVVRMPQSVLLPTPQVARRMRGLITKNDIDIVWFGAAAPLGLLGRVAHQAGARRVIASTHGHEVGWSMLPGSRQLLRCIGNRVDVITYVSQYAMRRMSRAVGPHATRVQLSPAVDTQRFTPDPLAGQTIRDRYGLGEGPVIMCISRVVRRKGQDQLVAVMPQVLRRHPNAHLMIVGPGDFATTLRQRAAAMGIAENVTITGPVDADELPAFYNAADIFAMPVRTRGGGLDVEGFGIVFIEAQACGCATIAGDGGGAPETIRPGAGLVVNGRRRSSLLRAIDQLLTDASYRQRIQQCARQTAVTVWGTDTLYKRFSALCSLHTDLADLTPATGSES